MFCEKLRPNMEPLTEHDSSKISGILVIEPINVEGAHAFFLAGEHSLVVPLSLIHKTSLQNEFEEDFQIALDSTQTFETQKVSTCVSMQIRLKWATRATACPDAAL